MTTTAANTAKQAMHLKAAEKLATLLATADALEYSACIPSLQQNADEFRRSAALLRDQAIDTYTNLVFSSKPL